MGRCAFCGRNFLPYAPALFGLSPLTMAESTRLERKKFDTEQIAQFHSLRRGAAAHECRSAGQGARIVIAIAATAVQD